jgi:hypothetical protein
MFTAEPVLVVKKNSQEKVSFVPTLLQMRAGKKPPLKKRTLSKQTRKQKYSQSEFLL